MTTHMRRVFKLAALNRCTERLSSGCWRFTIQQFSQQPAGLLFQ